MMRCWPRSPRLPLAATCRRVRTSTVDSVAYAPDGTLAVFTNGGIFLYDDPRLETRKGLIHLVGLPSFKEPAQYKYNLSRDGTTVACLVICPRHP